MALDVDHFILDEEGDCLRLNPRWLQHIQVTCSVFYTVASTRTSNVYQAAMHEEGDSSTDNLASLIASVHSRSIDTP